MKKSVKYVAFDDNEDSEKDEEQTAQDGHRQ